MRLEWKTVKPESPPQIHFSFQNMAFVVFDPTMPSLRYGHVTNVERPDTIESQFQYLLGLFKAEGSKKENLRVVAVCDPNFVGREKILNEIKRYQFPLKFKMLALAQERVLRIDSRTADVCLKPTKVQPVEKTKILIVEDSIPVQKILKRAYSTMSSAEVVGVASSVEEAVNKFIELKPDFISLDMKLNGGTGIDVLRKIDLKSHQSQLKKKIRCVLVTDCSIEEGDLVFTAMELGAATYIQKPHATNLEEFSDQLTELIRELMSRSSNQSKAVNDNQVKPKARDVDLIAIGSSTGGTEVIKDMICQLSNCTTPIVIVQHMPEQFTGLFASRIQNQSGRRVVEVSERLPIEQGCVYIARGGTHMTVESKGDRLYVNVSDKEPINRFKPSVSVLFGSIRDAHLASRTVAVMLTGMGRDGAQEMLQLKNKGAYTIGQSEETCVVYGMPRAAAEAGALCWSASPESISRYIRTLSLTHNSQAS